mgnify:CR=1 FL=1
MPAKTKKTSPQKETWDEVKANPKDKDANIDRIVKSKGFEVPTPLGPGVEARRKFFIFRWPGDQIEGVLGQSIVNVRRNTSYPIKLTARIAGGNNPDDSDYYKVGDVVEFFGNKMLHTVIRDNQLTGARVRIVYIGHQFLRFCGHPRKIFRVYKLSGFEEIEQLPGK